MMNNTMIGREVKTESCLITQNTCFLGLKPVLCSKVCAYYGHPNHCYIMFGFENFVQNNHRHC